MKRDELRELMKAIAYPEGWFYVERAAVIMFGLQSTIAPKLNGIQIGFPYITQFIMERNMKRLADAAAQAKVEATGRMSLSQIKDAAAADAVASASAKAEPPKSDTKEEALLN
jgi:hypothetical protein